MENAAKERTAFLLVILVNLDVDRRNADQARRHPWNFDRSKASLGAENTEASLWSVVCIPSQRFCLFPLLSSKWVGW